MDLGRDDIKSELRSGIVAAFNKSLNEALQFSPQMPFRIDNDVQPSLLVAVQKGELGTPGLPAAISSVKDDNNLIMLAVSPIERGTLKLFTLSTAFSVAGGEAINADYTIPAGKKWIVKGVSSTTNTFVGTLASSSIQIVATNVTSSGHILASGTSGDITYTLPNNITLHEGCKLRYRCTTSAWTSGQRLALFLVQELDI